MSLYKKHTNEIKTLHLLSQIIGKVKLKYAAQEPQCLEFSNICYINTL